MNNTIKKLINFLNFEKIKGEFKDYNCEITGWIKNYRSSSSSLAFCVIGDGSNCEGLQIVINDENVVENFLKDAKIGVNLKCYGKMVESIGSNQDFEMKLTKYEIVGNTTEDYPLSKNRINLDTLRGICHLRGRTNVFGCIFRIRSQLMYVINEFFKMKDYLYLDPNIITVNECEGGAGVFQITENDISNSNNLPYDKSNNYDWNQDHFNKKAYLTVSSQLQLEALACGLGNVFTMNKSFRSEHSCTSKHVSEFTHLEVEIINNKFDDLIILCKELISYCITNILKNNSSDLETLDKFVSKGIINKLNEIINSEFKVISHKDVIDLINKELKYNLNYDEDLSSENENFITKYFKGPVFVTNWPLKIKSFYMKRNDDNTCQSFDLLMPYGIGELIGGSQREESYEKLIQTMDEKNINKDNLQFYLDLRKYGTCHHGGFGLGFDRLLMLITGIENIKDVIPFPVYYKSCKY